MRKFLALLAVIAMAVIPSLAQGPVTGPYLVDYFSNNPPVAILGNITTGSALVSGIASTAGIQVGWEVTGPGIPAGTVVVSVIPPSFIILSAAPTTTLNQATLQFAPGVAAAAPIAKIRLTNFGTGGTPLTSPAGDVCTNIYVFDADQEMIACCSCRITPNGTRTISVAFNLTNNPLTSVSPVNGGLKVISTVAGLGTCSPLTYNGGFIDSTLGFATHLQISGGTSAGSFATETRFQAAALSGVEQSFLPLACQFTRYLGSGKGTCSCGTGS